MNQGFFEELLPGVFYRPGWLDHEMQQRFVTEWEVWREAPGASDHLTMAFGRKMSVETTCLGLQWVPYRYQKLNTSGLPVLPFPTWVGELAQRAVYETIFIHATTRFEPDVALVNYYDVNAKMGLHQDRDEATSDPVVSFSVGDSCRFRIGNSLNRNGPFVDVNLHSGDLLVFGGPARFAYHGVVKTTGRLTASQPFEGLPTGRLNVTVRNTGMAIGQK